MRFLTIFAILFLLPDLAMAGVFTPPPTDKSVDLLGHIFGPHIGSVYLGGTANPTLYRMFELFNSVVLSIGAMVVSYIGVVSTINTAQEGHVMGKKFSSLWIPMRSCIGMGLIIPTPHTGYSVIQTTVMWFIMQGIGAADHIWNSILKDLGQGISVTRGVQRPSDQFTFPLSHAAHVYNALEINGELLARDILNSEVCMQAIHKMMSSPINDRQDFRTPKDSWIKLIGRNVRPYETLSNDNYVNAQGAKFSGSLRIGIPGDDQFSDVCGNYSVTGSVRRSEWDQRMYITQADMKKQAHAIYRRKMDALHIMLYNYKPLVELIVNESHTLNPRGEHRRLVNLPGQQITYGGYRSQSTTTYREFLSSMVKPKIMDDKINIIREGMENGWITAGSFYFTLNEDTEVDFFDDVVKAPTAIDIPACNNRTLCREGYLPDTAHVLNPKLADFLQYIPEKTFMANMLWDAKIYFDNDNTIISDQLKLKKNGAENEEEPLQNLQKNMLTLLDTMMTEQHSDPLLAQGKFGVSIMLLAENSWIKPQAELQTLINRAEQGYSEITNELLRKIKELEHESSIALVIYSVIWIIGATLAIYIPLIPYMIFTIGVVGWFLLVIEAIVAAPILALSFTLPSGDELGKVVQGMMLLLNILLRPVLMLFGFILATRLYQAVVKLVNFGMLSNFSFLETGSSLFAWVAVITLYATFVVTLANKCFSLIYGLPDKILRWMGGAPEHSDVSQEMGQVKGAMTKGADTVNQISSGIPERNLARLQSRAKQLTNRDNPGNGPDNH